VVEPALSLWPGEVRAVVRAELAGTLRGEPLIVKCTNLALQLQASAGVGLVPHEIWHYLSDADIRTKDRKYAEAQLRRTVELLPLP
jgi:hypothetical protein